MQTLPYNNDAEQQILSTILTDPKELVDIRLSPDDFFSPSHKKLFQAAQELLLENVPIDLVTIGTKVDLEKIGNTETGYRGSLYLQWLTDACPISIDVANTARIIKECSKLRGLIKASFDIQKLAYSANGNAPEVIATAQNLIFTACEDDGKKGFSHIRNDMETLTDLIEANKLTPAGMTTGYVDIDGYYKGLHRGELTVLAARPGNGKTTFALNLARNMAFRGYKCAFQSIEMKRDLLNYRLVASQSGIDSMKMKCGNVSKHEWEPISKAISDLANIPLFIDDTPSVNIYDIKLNALRMKAKYGLDVLFIDYLQKIKMAKSFERHDLAIGDITNSLCILAKELNISIVLLSQLNREIEKRGNKKPQLSDLRESGDIEQDADAVWFLYDPAGGKQTEGVVPTFLYIAKNRNFATGEITLYFDKAHNEFLNRS